MYILKKHEEKPVKISIKIYINKIENRIKFKIKTEYYLELLTPETLKLLGSTKSKTTKKNENGENVFCLEITEVLHLFVPNKSFDQLLNILPKSFFFKYFIQNFHILMYCLKIKIPNC